MPAPKTLSPIPMLDLKAQYAAIREEIRAAMDGVLEAQQFILGPNVAALEEEVAAYCGTRFAVGVASGTDAIILALHALGVRPGDEVICPAFTYVATGDTISLLGAKPVFADILPDTFNLDPAQLEARITPRTKAILPVHLYGQSADMDAILEIAKRRKIAVVEDNAQAIGARYKGRRTGSLGDAGCISFFPSKNLGAYGDAGMIVTNSEALASRLKSLRGHGTIAHKYISEEQGWNSRLDELQAAVLRAKLRHLDAWAAARRERAEQYDAALAGVPTVAAPKVLPSCEHVYHQYTIRAQNRDRLQKDLAEQGIPSTVYYPVPLHRQPMFLVAGTPPVSLPVSEQAAREALSLPIYPELTVEQIQRIAEAVRNASRQ